MPRASGGVGGGPAAQGPAVVKAGPGLGVGRGLIRGGAVGEQAFDAEVAPFDDPALGFKGDVAAAPVAIGAAGDLGAVDGEAEDAVGGHDAVVVPLVGALAAQLAREAAVALAGAERLHRGTMDREDVAVRGEPVGLAVAMVEHLDLDGAEEGLAGGGQGAGPDEHARVAAGLHVTPFELEDEVLELPRRAQRARGDAIAVQNAVTRHEGLGGAVHVDPALQVPAVEQGLEAVVRRRPMRQPPQAQRRHPDPLAHPSPCACRHDRSFRRMHRTA